MQLINLLFGLACSQGGITEKADIDDTSLLNIQVQLHENTNLGALFQATTADETSIQLIVEHPDLPSWRTLPTTMGTVHEIEVFGLRADEVYTFTPVLLDGTNEQPGESITFSSGSLPIEFPTYHFESNINSTEGITLFGMSMNGYYGIGVDSEGEIVWYQKDDAILDRTIDRQIKPLGNNVFLSTTKTGFREIDASTEVLLNLSEVEMNNIRIHHDAIKLPNGNYLAISREFINVDEPQLGGEATLRGDKVVEVDPTGALQWSWSSFANLDTSRFPTNLSKMSSPAANDVVDWTHSNGLDYNPDTDSFLLSVRHQNWVVNIDKQTGDILWKLGRDGDFSLVNGTWFNAQHNATWLDNDSILLYDNGNERPESDGGLYSRAVIYDLDYNNMTATQRWDFAVPYFTERLGGVTTLENGNFLICAGGPGRSVNAPAIIMEVVPNTEEIVWQLTADDQSIYRAYRIHGFGEP